jgi:hypothetical protein
VDHDDGHIGIVAGNVAVLVVDFGFVALGLAFPLETLETAGTHDGGQRGGVREWVVVRRDYWKDTRRMIPTRNLV